MDPNATDLETADLVLQTSLQEVEEALRLLNRDANDGRTQARDEKVALLYWRAELRRRIRTQQDRREALQISRESRLDQAAILQDIHGREVNEAPAAHVQPAGRAPTQPQVPGPQVPSQPQESRRTLGNPDVLTQTRKRAYDTTTAVVPHYGVLRECVACSESYPESGMIRNSCSHIYCQGCITHLLENSLADESLFPPRCCRLPLPLEATRGIINVDLWARFEEKKIEHGDKHRTYCSDPACSRYILPSRVRGTIGTCRVCNRKTCTLCKKKTHQGECVDDRIEVLELGKAKGWQRCLNCSHLVELRSGCNHITCRCRHEFCYVCSTPWKQCECAHWDEAMLEERAGVIAARNQPARPARQVVEQAAQFLVEQHDCYHDGAWKKLGISAECEECGDLMPDYIFECRHCGLQACNACRINRF
ncbi:hypothetical protein N7516_003696 [Penicillium verrucosum]|uniref:uncharacterized protein n=1 Tax=Penicillium verrucosum TaxID=60171 RepID=UPI00254530C4|nr:uncharacterized protein N7516_003696 [Penicillium verrucosum]KAJ5943528.1 hypothetical protein N7516_003696 [Penicillium verrucosum]